MNPIPLKFILQTNNLEGEIISTNDLIDSQVIVKVMDATTNNNQINTVLKELRESIKITFFIFKLSSGIQITVYERQMSKEKFKEELFPSEVYTVFTMENL